uniref:Glycylpeptide N-tetradecanoyltransferase n=1 Tax=Cebus imitator TaxID=2715852 RepID=A0A2K5RD93_CEBIM
MADESETAVKLPAPPLLQMIEGNRNGHEHCSNCENEEDNSYNRGGLSPANDTGIDSTQNQHVKTNSLLAERIQEILAIELFSVGQGPAITTAEKPYTLSQGFTWDALDLGDCGVLKKLYTLLNENYAEDDDSMFQFYYSLEFLLWALQPPGWLPHWKLVGFMSTIPANIHIYDTEKIVKINFLCVHEKLFLIPEITRQVHLESIFQAVYTAGVVLPKPVGTCRYWHPSLNPRKLIDVKFSHLSRNMTMQHIMKLYQLPDSQDSWAATNGKKKDIPVVHQLFTRYMKQFHLMPVMSQEEVEHSFYPRNIIDTFMVENGNGEVTDFLSFYMLPSTIMNHPTHKSLKAAYSFYKVHTQTPLLDLRKDALVLPKMKGLDVFSALDLTENKTFLEKLKFGIGHANLQYYLHTWKCPSVGAEKVRLVLQQ